MKDYEITVKFKVRGNDDGTDLMGYPDLPSRLGHEIAQDLMSGNNDVIVESNKGTERPFLYPEFEIICISEVKT